MTVRWIPLIAFTPFAVSWMVLHWRAVCRVEIERERVEIERERVEIEHRLAELRAIVGLPDASLPEIWEAIADALRPTIAAATAAFAAFGAAVEQALRPVFAAFSAAAQHDEEQP